MPSKILTSDKLFRHLTGHHLINHYRNHPTYNLGQRNIFLPKKFLLTQCI
ncbi:hypothetical protein BN2497_1017 [Janthinobacterium sp. CG23_2]|nr:hypothetical protein BN2497_1017 [Janthinobacterium sp. CG23_2]CUU26906.1 hypothetical protein BN3177_1017 [Janthinobacterium sp. CG23_2]